MAKFVAFVSTASLICVLIAIIIYQRLFPADFVRRTLDPPAVVKEIRPLKELVTVKYSVEKVVGIKEEKSPIGTESILLLVQGKVLAGIDFSELKPSDVMISKNNLVRIRLTPVHIQETYLDEKHTKVWDRSITWWTPWVIPDADLEHKARLQALDDIKNAALEMGILTEAQRNAEAAIREILEAFGVQKVVFVYGA